MKYIDEVQKGMDLLGSHPKSIFIGQAVEYKGTALTHQVKNFPQEKLLELPVAEEFQAGFAIGLALEGYLPVSLYPRMNFIILAMNQIINHLDKRDAEAFKSMSTNIDVVELLYPYQVFDAYKKALDTDKSTLIIEHGDMYK